MRKNLTLPSQKLWYILAQRIKSNDLSLALSTYINANRQRGNPNPIAARIFEDPPATPGLIRKVPPGYQWARQSIEILAFGEELK
jgi:hypothetical protein